jgi:iron complex outermembrane receptor protein
LERLVKVLERKRAPFREENIVSYRQRPFGRSHRHALLSASAFCALLGLAAPALAQAQSQQAQGQAAQGQAGKADASEVETVVVTGFATAWSRR